MAVLGKGPSSVLNLPPPSVYVVNHRHLHSATSILRFRHLSGKARVLFRSSNSRIKTSQHDSAESFKAANSEVVPEDQNKAFKVDIGSLDNKNASNGNSFLSKLGILLGIAAVITLVLVGVKPASLGTSTGIQFLQDGSSSSTLAAPTGAFSFRAFGYRVLLPQYAPGWLYFWLLMAAGCGLFISEEALNIWVI